MVSYACWYFMPTTTGCDVLTVKICTTWQCALNRSNTFANNENSCLLWSEVQKTFSHKHDQLLHDQVYKGLLLVWSSPLLVPLSFEYFRHEYESIQFQKT